MDKEAAYQLFQKLITQLAGQGTSVLAEIESRSRLRTLDSGSFFCLEGQPFDGACFVIHGLLELFYNREDGKEAIFRFSKEGDFAAPYIGVITKTDSECSIRALESTQIIEIRYSDWEDLMLKDPVLERVGRKVAESEFVNRAVRERLFLIADAKDRYLHFQSKFLHLKDRIPSTK